MGKQDRRERTDDRAGRTKILLALFLAVGFCGYAPLSSIQTLNLESGHIATTTYAVQEDPWQHPRLRRLRQSEKIDEVVAPGRSQFEKIVLLRAWARRQWDSGPQPFYYPAWDALEILDLARRRRNKAFCAQYAVLFLQSARSLGLHARYLDLGHFIASVWSDEFNRWVVMDPTNDLHYEKGGEPMGDWELIRAAWSGRVAGIEIVGPGSARRPASSAELAPFRALKVCMLNDQLTNPAVMIQNGKKRVLALESDYRRYPLVGKERIGYGNYCLGWKEGEEAPADPASPHSGERDDFRQALNQTVLLVADEREDQGVLKLRLFTETAPEFQAFVGGPEGQAPGDLTPHIQWNLRPGFNAFTARVRTAAGWLGPASRINVYYKPSWTKAVSYRLASLR